MCQCGKPGKTLASLYEDRLERLPVQQREPYGAHHTCATQSVLAAHCFQNSGFFWFRWNYAFYVLMPGYWSEKYNSEHVVLGFTDLVEGSLKLSCFCFSEAKCVDVSPGFLSDPLWLQFFLVFQCASGLLFLLSCL